MILASFVALFGGGILVYGAAWGSPRAAAPATGADVDMVTDQIERRGVSHPGVLAAMRAVPRHQFVPASERAAAYDDHPLPIGSGQTISQPYVVAAMTELLDPEPGDVMLEVGTGSGYQAAVLAALVRHVYSVEIVPELAAQAVENLAAAGIENVTVTRGDGAGGDPAHAPFDGIIVTAAPKVVPPKLLEQLAPGARMVIPVGDDVQELRVYERTPDGELTERAVSLVRFVPMKGDIER